MSQVEVKVNKILVFVLIVQFLFCLLVAILHNIASRTKRTHLTPLIPSPNESLILDSVLIFFSYYILINSMIPISLVVSM